MTPTVTMRAMLGALLVALPALGAPPNKSSDRSDVERSADPKDKMICKRFADTGSLVATNKLCKTKREWDNYRTELSQSFKTGSCAGNADGGIC